jgi:hypothetical protein
VQALKRRKDTLCMFLGKANPVILHSDNPFTLLQFGRDMNARKLLPFTKLQSAFEKGRSRMLMSIDDVPQTV